MVSDGPSSLWEVAEGRGRKPQEGLAAKIIEARLATKPAGQTHWSNREMARQQGVHHSTVARIWSESEIKPQRKSIVIACDGTPGYCSTNRVFPVF